MKNRTFALLVLALFPVAVLCQSHKPIQLTDEQRQSLKSADDLMNQCDLAREKGNLEQAEKQCRAAIQLVQSTGWRASGETATLGMILFEQGHKRLGFETLRDSFHGYHGSNEREFFLGRAALELGEYKTALEIVGTFRQGKISAGPGPNTTIAYWPKGDDSKALTATLDFLEGSRLSQILAKKTKGIELLRKAKKLYPDNVAINFVLGIELKDDEDPAIPAQYLKVVIDNASGAVKKAADIIYRDVMFRAEILARKKTEESKSK